MPKLRMTTSKINKDMMILMMTRPEPVGWRLEWTVEQILNKQLWAGLEPGVL